MINKLNTKKDKELKKENPNTDKKHENGPPKKKKEKMELE